MPDAYLLETFTDIDEKMGDSQGSDIHGSYGVINSLDHPPNTGFPAYLVIQTDEFIDSHDNQVRIRRYPSSGADYVLIGHLTRGAKTHILEIRAPFVAQQGMEVEIRPRTISGEPYLGTGVDPGELDDFGITAIQVLYRPEYGAETPQPPSVDVGTH